MSIIDRYDSIAVDLDGVIWRHGQIIPGAPQAIDAIRAAGKHLLFLTNNALRPAGEVAAILKTAGIQATEEEILTTAAVAREWIEGQQMIGVRTFFVATSEVIDQFKGLLEPADGGQIDLVFVARDVNFTFERLKLSSDAVRAGAAFVAVNRDPVLPVPRGLEPGTGALLAAIETAAGSRAVVLGKPEDPMMNAAARRLGGRILMIGDQISSDVAGAERAGWDSLLVLTGATSGPGPFRPAPTYVLGSIAELPVADERAQAVP